MTVIIGAWGVLAGPDLPLWAAVYNHVADIFCHAIVTSSLVGVVIDLSLAVVKCRVGHFVADFCMCKDNIEQHSVTGRCGMAAEDSAQPNADQSQAGSTWLMFVFFLCFYVLDHRGEVPETVHKTLSLLGIACWAGIAWWVVDRLVRLESLCLELYTDDGDI
eukprot:CAMPEP_0170650470 /NCGR_PEP_ID=MMETSP0224-20130122/45819_1 /TAXON_ID=285029 /ORGANISM="Togula jolla, Strain CCCM 725" /LENGTH=161 /DNA_ID=CAMNT_0010982133 /DNA_START=40 /DNA_END=525 /DNA_ORIENTATION=-